MRFLKVLALVVPMVASAETATFAGGCFWCVQADFDKVKGVTSTEVGFMGGYIPNPTYNQVSTGDTGHREVLQVTFDPNVVSYEALLEVFWNNIDPTDPNGQFCDRGQTYSSAIYYHSTEQKKQAEKSFFKAKSKFGKVYTQLTKATQFYAAEEYHQKYYKKNPVRYNFYRYGCGRDQRLEELWGPTSD